MNESELGKKVAQLLNHSLDNIDQSILTRLQSGRIASIENYREYETTLATAGGSPNISKPHSSYFNIRNILPLVTLLLILISYTYWQSFQYSDENDEIDILLLTDDLPINAYLDNDFDVWLDS
jgi:hypothetical protein